MKPSLLRLKLDLIKIHCMVANTGNVTAIDDATETDKGDHWISTETGSHVLLDGEGNIKGGMGGKFSGLNMSDVKKKDGETSHSSVVSGAQKINDKAKKEHDTDKREHPNWESSQAEFNAPITTSHKSDPADLFSTKGAAHTSHKFNDATHAEDYINDIDAKLTNNGYTKKDSGDTTTYTKGDHVYSVSHNLNYDDADTDMSDEEYDNLYEENHDEYGDFTPTIKVTSGRIDSSLVGAEPVKKVETNAGGMSAFLKGSYGATAKQPAQPNDKKESNSLTMRDNPAKLSPTSQSGAANGEGKMNYYQLKASRDELKNKIEKGISYTFPANSAQKWAAGATVTGGVHDGAGNVKFFEVVNPKGVVSGDFSDRHNKKSHGIMARSSDKPELQESIKKMDLLKKELSDTEILLRTTDEPQEIKDKNALQSAKSDYQNASDNYFYAHAHAMEYGSGGFEKAAKLEAIKDEAFKKLQSLRPQAKQPTPEAKPSPENESSNSLTIRDNPAKLSPTSQVEAGKSGDKTMNIEGTPAKRDTTGNYIVPDGYKIIKNEIPKDEDLRVSYKGGQEVWGQKKEGKNNEKTTFLRKKNSFESQELPELTGSEKQITWAKKIRDSFIADKSEWLTDTNIDRSKKMVEEKSGTPEQQKAAMNLLKMADFAKNSSSKFWIDNDGYMRQTVRNLVSGEIDNIK